MKKHLFLIVISIQVLSSCFTKKLTIKSDEEKGNIALVKKCSENPDTLYNRRKVLEVFAAVLNSSVPEYKEVFPKGFYINDDGKCVGFSIYDLTDTLNKEASFGECVNFYNYHVYHFYPNIITYSYSHIAVLKDSNIKIYKSVNCKGDNIKNVIIYLNQMLADNPQKEGIINRVKNYRKYGDYYRIDEQSDFICK